MEPFIVSPLPEMLVWNSRNATSRQRSKELNINCAELFSPPALLPGAAAQVQGSHRSPAECSVSITGTSHGAVTREAASHPPICGPSALPTSSGHTCTHTVHGLGAIKPCVHTCRCHYEADISIRARFLRTGRSPEFFPFEG